MINLKETFTKLLSFLFRVHSERKKDTFRVVVYINNAHVRAVVSEETAQQICRLVGQTGTSLCNGVNKEGSNESRFH